MATKNDLQSLLAIQNGCLEASGTFKSLLGSWRRFQRLLVPKNDL